MMSSVQHHCNQILPLLHLGKLNIIEGRSSELRRPKCNSWFLRTHLKYTPMCICKHKVIAFLQITYCPLSIQPLPRSRASAAVRNPDRQQWCEQILLSSSHPLELHPAALLLSLAPFGSTRLISKNWTNNALRNGACVHVYLWFTRALKEPL